MIEDFNFNVFEKGYPKKIFFKHITPLRIYYDSNNQIFGCLPRRIEFWKYVYTKEEEINLRQEKINLR